MNTMNSITWSNFWILAAPKTSGQDGHQALWSTLKIGDQQWLMNGFVHESWGQRRETNSECPRYYKHRINWINHQRGETTLFSCIAPAKCPTAIVAWCLWKFLAGLLESTEDAPGQRRGGVMTCVRTIVTIENANQLSKYFVKFH